MTYEEMRKVARSGDVLLCEKRGFISAMIRILTAQQISHVALLVWMDGTLWVAEMKEFKGYSLMPASLWVQDRLSEKTRLYFGTAPLVVYDNEKYLMQEVLHYRNDSYGYLSLFRVWLGQLIPGRRRNRKLVCSTFVARVWEACSVVFERTPAPGEYLRMCRSVSRVSD